jgi:multiubiquitin
MSHAKDTEGKNGSPKIRVTVVIATRYAFDTEWVTGKQIKERANIPAGFALYRRTRGGNESIRDDDTVELHDGDHFFARPPGSPRALSDD